MATAYVAAGTIRRARFVKLNPSANNQVLEADANEIVFGISQVGGRDAPIPENTTDPPNAAVIGDHLNVHQLGVECLLEAGSGGWAADARLKSDADGKGVAIATTGTTIQHVGARALEAASAGELGRVVVMITSERPALT